MRGAYFTQHGVQLFYRDEGRGEPVILLHGFAVDGDINWRWPGIAAALRPDFRVITPDLRGHGRSDKPRSPGTYGYALVVDILQLMDRLELPQAHMVGYSLGGFIALKLAVEAPQRLLSLALVAAGWIDPRNSFFTLAVPRFVSALRTKHPIGPLTEGLEPKRPPPGLINRLSERLMTSLLCDRVALAALVEQLSELTVTTDEVAQICLPVLVVIGSKDPLMIEAEALAQRVPHGRLLSVAGAGHIGLALRRKLRLTLKRFLLEAGGHPTEPAT